MKKSGDIFIPDEVFEGEEHHPQCCFFELFPSTPDPYENFFGLKFCHMSLCENDAKICNGDYFECPLSGNMIMENWQLKKDRKNLIDLIFEYTDGSISLGQIEKMIKE